MSDFVNKIVEEEKKKNSKVTNFLNVVGVCTLMMAILGASFWFFVNLLTEQGKANLAPTISAVDRKMGEVKAANDKQVEAQKNFEIAMRGMNKGDRGDPGKDGIDGKNGVDGLPGAKGERGNDGTNGIDGVNGQDGRKGDPGKDGTNGKDGVAGKDYDNQAHQAAIHALNRQVAMLSAAIESAKSDLQELKEFRLFSCAIVAANTNIYTNEDENPTHVQRVTAKVFKLDSEGQYVKVRFSEDFDGWVEKSRLKTC